MYKLRTGSITDSGTDQVHSQILKVHWPRSAEMMRKERGNIARFRVPIVMFMIDHTADVVAS